MIEWLFIILLLLCPRRGAYPSSAAARRAWEREAEGDLFKGSVIGGNPQFVHHYKQGAQGTRHSISVRGGISIRPSLRRKLWKRKWHILLSLGLVVITILTGLPTVLGVTKTWDGSGARKWSASANWSPAGEPADGDDVVFDATDTGNCKVDVNTNNINSVDMTSAWGGTLDINGFTLRVEYTADGSNFTGTNGVCTADGTILVSGTWNTNSANFTFTHQNGTVTVSGTGNLSARTGSSHAFYDLSTGAPGKTTTMLTYMSIDGTLTVGTGTLGRSGAQYVYLYNTTTPLVNGGTISCHVSYAQTSAVTVVGTTYGGILRIMPSNAVVCTLGGATTVSSELQIYNAVATNTVTLKTAGYQLDVGSTTRCGHVDGTKYGVLDCDAATINLDDVLIYGTPSYWLMDTCTCTVGGNWTNYSTSGSWDEGTSIIKFDSLSAQNIDNNGRDFYNVHVMGSGQKNFTGNLTTNDLRALYNVQVNITATGVTWTTFNGAQIYADATYTLTLRSTITDNAWDMVAGTGNVALRVDVKDSNNTGTDVDATDASNTNSGGNTGWDFVGGAIVTLAGSTAGQAGASGATKLTMKVSGSSGGAGGASAPLKATREIIGSISGQSGADGVSKLTMKIVGDSGGASGVSGAVKVLRELIGSVAGQSSASGLAKVIRELIGSSAGQSSASGTLTISGEILLQGSTAGQSGADAAVKLTMKLAGDAAGASGTSSILKLTRTIAGTSDAQSAADAVLKAIRGVAGSIAAQSGTAGDVKVEWGLSGTIDAQSGASATPKVTFKISGSVDAVSSLIGDLTVAVVTIGRTEAEITLTITTSVALDESIGTTVAMDRAITRTKEIEVEI